MMQLKRIFSTMVLFLIVTFTLVGCGGGGGGPRPTTGSIKGVVDFGGVTPASTKSYSSVGPMVASSLTDSSDQKIIKFRTDLPYSEVEKIVSSMGGSIMKKMYGFANTYVISLNVSSASLKSLAASNANIEHIEIDKYCYASITPPSDPLFNSQTNLILLNLLNGWCFITDASSVTVAVVDTGVMHTHNDLVNRVDTTHLTGSDFLSNPPGNDPSDQNGHGTHVAGIIGAEANNAIGIAGICWNVKILPVRVLDSTGKGTVSNIASGIKFAVDSGAKVINLSMEGRFTPDEAPVEFKEAIDYAISKNVTVVAAAGNENSWVGFPANYQPQVIAVSALNDDGSDRAAYSNYGPEVTVCAPGGSGTGIGSGILSTWNDGDYIKESGTSMACPHISGLVALMYAQNPSIYPSAVKQHLQTYVYDKGAPGRDDYFGAGLPNAAGVLGNQSAKTLPEIRVFIGRSDGTIETETYPDGKGNYNLTSVQPGVKFVCAFLDKNMNNQVDPGDRFTFVGNVSVQAGETQNVNFALNTDIPIGTAAKSLSQYLQDNLR